MEAIGTLAGGVAHDFNNLLMGIQGCASLMLLHTDPHCSHIDKLRTIETLIQSGADLTKQILGYARGGRLSQEAAVRTTSSVFDLMGGQEGIPLTADEQITIDVTSEMLHSLG